MRPPLFIPKELLYSKKPKLRIDRMISFQEIYKDSREEYTEHNIFEELLLSLPKEDLEMCNTISLFEDALDSIIGKKKIYINI